VTGFDQVQTPVKFLALSGGGQLTESVMLKAYGMNGSLVTGYANGGASQQDSCVETETASVISNQ